MSKKSHKQSPRSAYWLAWFDGSAKPNPGACKIAGIVQGQAYQTQQFCHAIGYGDSSDAEYQALIAVLELLVKTLSEALNSEASNSEASNSAEIPATSALNPHNQTGNFVTDLPVHTVCIYGDSQVVIDDVNGTEEKSSLRLKAYRQQAIALLKKLPHARLVWIPRHKNTEVDGLLRLEHEFCTDASLEDSAQAAI